MWWWILSLVNTWERCLFSQWHRWPASKLSGALWRLGGKRKESLQLCLWNLNSTSNCHVVPRRLSCQISANQSARSRNQRECKQTLKNTWKHATWVMTSLLKTSPRISISHRLLRCRYSNSRDVVASSTSFFRPAARAPLRAWWKAIHLLLFPGKLFPLPEKLWLCKSLHSSFAFHIIQRLFPTTEDIKETCRSILWGG